MQQGKTPTRRIAGTRRPGTGEPIAPRRPHIGEASPTGDANPQIRATPSPRTGAAPVDAQVLLTPEQAAALLQVRPSWLRRKAAARAIPCRYLGKHLRFTHADLTAIAEQSAAGTTGDPDIRGRRVP